MCSRVALLRSAVLRRAVVRSAVLRCAGLLSLLAGSWGAAPAAAEPVSRYQVTMHPLPGREEAAREIAGRMRTLAESLESAYARFWGAPVVPGILPPSVRIDLFEDPAELRSRLAALGADRLSYEAGGAFVRSPPALLVLAASPLERVVAANLVHEAAHMLNHALLGHRISPWLNEGLAGFCQYSTIGPDGAIQLGTMDRGASIRVMQGGQEVIHRFEPERSLSYLSGQFARDSKLSVAPMLAIADPAAFYLQDAPLHYAASWTLVHLLAEGSLRRAGGDLKPHLLRYAALEQQGGGGLEALLGLLRVPIEDLDYAWFRHVKKLE